jgi:hypothetical protein
MLKESPYGMRATHQAHRRAKDALECVVDLHCWAEAVGQSPISTAIIGMEIGD